MLESHICDIISLIFVPLQPGSDCISRKGRPELSLMILSQSRGGAGRGADDVERIVVCNVSTYKLSPGWL